MLIGQAAILEHLQAISRTCQVQLEQAKKHGQWPDGSAVGKHLHTPFLEWKYVLPIVEIRKQVEGRAYYGWVQKAAMNDYVTFTVSKLQPPQKPALKLICRITSVEWFKTFEDMLRKCGVHSCLPGFKGPLQEAATLYRSFKTKSDGPQPYLFSDLEREHGVASIHIVPLTEIRWMDMLD